MKKNKEKKPRGNILPVVGIVIIVVAIVVWFVLGVIDYFEMKRQEEIAELRDIYEDLVGIDYEEEDFEAFVYRREHNGKNPEGYVPSKSYEDEDDGDGNVFSNYLETDRTGRPLPELEQCTPSEAKYVLNLNTYTIHVVGCSSIDKMAEHNKFYYNGPLSDAFDEDFTCCANCFAGADNEPFTEID